MIALSYLVISPISNDYSKFSDNSSEKVIVHLMNLSLLGVPKL